MIEVLAFVLLAVNIGLVALLVSCLRKLARVCEINNALLKALTDISQALDTHLPPSIQMYTSRETEPDDPSATIGTFGGPATWN